jgi:hypothetical protein
MHTPKRDGSMYTRAAAGQLLISRETALAICRMVVKDLYGEGECKVQEPLTLEDGLGVWAIEGSRILPADATAADRGPLNMSIAKFDGTIVSFTL